ncbi:MAG: DUF2335 domain-containing protein [Bergeyella sp.]|nr:DUF2335 domain-containing protein [Bergeyella sp.]
MSPEKSNPQKTGEVDRTVPGDLNVNEPSPEDRKREAGGVPFATLTQHYGPLPDVDSLSGYARLIPNGAERLMRQVELQSEHRRKMDASIIKSNNIQSYIGQFFGFFIAVIFAGVSYVLAMNNHEQTAVVLGGGTILGLVTIFVLGKKLQNRG